ncbi:MAG: hypothetical protein Kow00123_03560 [Anaerolineales bacterium]
METKSLVLNRGMIWVGAAKLALALAAALAITNMGLPQYVTGPLVNALLLLTLEWCGLGQALVVGMVTPMGAALRGILPLPLWVMIPFIAVGNAAFVGIFHLLRGRNRAVALVVAAVVKFAWLYAAVTALVVWPLQVAVGGNVATVAIPQALVNMMRWPQLGTALAGGVLAFGVQGVVRMARRRSNG